ncbi:protein ImuB [Pelagibacterium halotolerans]|uniref:DNA polymerase-like protein n=2 Tax=Pelagibacterium TaxID=1082930 RepID=G4RGY1_PELHB|nr:DNA polymerase-like protein [Pelagibacterium halotolerans B2]QJR20437.1 DNA polymerase Y family protein [Pelagibacterium halotolerans]SEA88628.1 protein ImuB [Pelagibacterium halotolerans]
MRLASKDGRKQGEHPLVVVARRGNILALVGADASARRQGLRPGLAFADAKARVPQLEVVEHDETADAELLERLADWCDRYSPLIATEPPDGIVCDITGVPHLFGGEAGLVADMEARLKAQGFATRIGVAGTARAARALARFGRGGIVEPGGEAHALAGLPVEALEAGEKTTMGLRRAGLTAIGDLAARPRKPLAARFGDAMTAALAQLLGEIDRPITPRRPLPDFVAEQRFADPIGLMDDIVAALATLSQDLCKSLDRHGQGGRCFEAAFFRADGKVTRIELLSGQPLKEAGALTRLLEMRLEALVDPIDPGFGFDMIRLSVLAGDDMDAIQGGLDGRAMALVEVRDLLDRLSARFGAGAVQRFVADDSHLPERAARAIPAISDETPVGTWRKAGPFGVPARPLFLFYPPPLIEVIAEVPHGPPRRFSWRRAWFDIVAAEGPERIAPEWWRKTSDTRARDYFRIEDEKGRRFWVFRYGFYGIGTEPVRWYLHGVFP